LNSHWSDIPVLLPEWLIVQLGILL